ncbi:MFS general substrate transporter [Alternaria alternata]|nr:MFS general substrate transporter [Alternaria alternata]
MVGQILTGLAQPFVLAAPTRYSDMWFTEGGRVGATALASLANPFGAAHVFRYVSPLYPIFHTYFPKPKSGHVIKYKKQSFFIPASPPSPPSASSAISKTPISTSIRTMLRTPSFYLVFFTFGIYTGFFNAFTSLLNQILYPYGYTEDEAGICGAVLIVVGLVACAITSPIADKTHAYLLGIKILCPILSAAYLAMIWAPQTRSIAAPYVLSAVLGACSFSLLPIALEYLVEISFPASPEVSSTICWVGGQVFGGIFIVVMNELKDGRPVDLEQVQKAGRGQAAKGGDRPPGHMFWALVFQAVVCALVLPLPLMLGVERLGFASREGRLKKDVDGDSVVVGGAGERGNVEVNGEVPGAER